MHQLTDRLSDRPTNQPTVRPTNQLANRPTNRSTNRPTDRLTDRTIYRTRTNQPTKQPAHQPTKSLSTHLFIHPSSQSINQLTKQLLLLCGRSLYVVINGKFFRVSHWLVKLCILFFCVFFSGWCVHGFLYCLFSFCSHHNYLLFLFHGYLPCQWLFN